MDAGPSSGDRARARDRAIEGLVTSLRVVSRVECVDCERRCLGLEKSQSVSRLRDGRARGGDGGPTARRSSHIRPPTDTLSESSPAPVPQNPVQFTRPLPLLDPPIHFRPPIPSRPAHIRAVDVTTASASVPPQKEEAPARPHPRPRGTISSRVPLVAIGSVRGNMVSSLCSFCARAQGSSNPLACSSSLARGPSPKQCFWIAPDCPPPLQSLTRERNRCLGNAMTGGCVRPLGPRARATDSLVARFGGGLAGAARRRRRADGSSKLTP